MRHRPIATLLVLGVLAGMAAPVTADIAETGQPPPLFALPDEEGTVHDVAELLGQPTVLYFTHNMCHYCTQIISFLKRARTAYGEDELAIDTHVRAARADYRGAYEQRWDNLDHFCQRYGVHLLPMSTEDDPVAQALKYTHDASTVDPASRPQPAADQTCLNCAQIQGNDGDQWRPCAIFVGKLVNANGWCNVWVAKP